MPNIRIPADYRLTVDDLRREPGRLHPTKLALAALGVVNSYDTAKQLIRDRKLRQPYRVGERELSEARDLLKLLGAPLVHPADAPAALDEGGSAPEPRSERFTPPGNAHEPRVGALAPPNSAERAIAQAESAVR